MPRNYNSNTTTGGASGSGRAYTPQVTPWQRDDDNVSVLGGNRGSRDYYNANPYTRDDYDAHGRHDHSADRDRRYDRQRDDEAYYGRDLVPTYGQAGFGANDREGRHDRNDRDYREARHEDERRAGHRKHWENREPDYRYQYNDYDRVHDRDVRRENLSRDRDDLRTSGYRSDHQREDVRREDWGYTEGPNYNPERYAREYREDRYNDREREYSRDRNDGRGNGYRR